jgi:E3 ubiquitin-protein ligase SHPRH
MCKKKLRSSEFKNISLKPSEINVHEETHNTTNVSQDSASGPSKSSISSNVSNSMMKEIKMIDLEGSYGSKIDMIARHLLWIRTNDPGAKSIIFSQYRDFLEVLRAAFVKWKIGVSGIAEKDGIHKFKDDRSIECFLLDAKSDSSGLNLVNATYVFLCEPLINPAIELQAIARVHRIGQRRPTTVFMYLISDTVEQAIYEISVARRLEHMKTARPQTLTPAFVSPVDEENTLDAANSAEMEAAPLKQLLTKKGDGEMVQANDLWACLFSKARKTNSSLSRPDSAMNKYIRAEAAEARLMGQ